MSISFITKFRGDIRLFMDGSLLSYFCNICSFFWLAAVANMYYTRYHSNYMYPTLSLFLSFSKKCWRWYQLQQLAISQKWLSLCKCDPCMESHMQLCYSTGCRAGSGLDPTRGCFWGLKPNPHLFWRPQVNREDPKTDPRWTRLADLYYLAHICMIFKEKVGPEVDPPKFLGP